MTAHPLDHLGFEALLSRPRCPGAVDAASGRAVVQPTADPAVRLPIPGAEPAANRARKNAKRLQADAAMKPTVVKGARVRLADGTRARVEYADPNMRIARVRTEDGRNVTVRHKDLRGAGG